jgi:hypothetical protein
MLLRLPDFVVIGPLNQPLELLRRERFAGMLGHLDEQHDGAQGEHFGQQHVIGARRRGGLEQHVAGPRAQRPARRRARDRGPFLGGHLRTDALHSPIRHSGLPCRDERSRNRARREVSRTQQVAFPLHS